MNRKRRARLSDTISLLCRVISSLELISEEELEAFTNMPDSLQESERGENMESIISTIDDATEQVSEVMSSLQEIVQTRL